MDRKEMDRCLELALDCCEDWQPVKYWESKQIETIWFSRKQLKEFIERIKTDTTAEQ